jgi:ammonia channel protein AmtB
VAKGADAVQHSVLTIVSTFAILAVIPALSVQYREFLDRTGLHASTALTVFISGSSLLIWLLISLFIPGVRESPLEYPTAALAAVAGFLASLTVRDTTSHPLTAALFSIGWTTLVFSPIAVLVLFPTSVGIPVTAGPLDLGGALPVQVAVGSGALVVLTFARRWAVEDRSHIRPRPWLLLACGLVIWAGWILGFIGLELEVDSVVTPRIILNSIVAPLCAVIGWMIGQRITTATTSASGAVAGLFCGVIAISAGSAYFQPLWAGLTGAAAGVACSIFVYRRIGKTGRHAWFIVGSHLIAASVGLVMLGLFGSTIGFIFDGQLTLLEVQLGSIAAVVVWAGLVSLLLWLAVRRAAGRALRDATSTA